MKRHLCISVVLFGLWAAVPASAEDSPARQLLRQRSQALGLASPTAQVLTRRLGPGNDVTAARAREVARTILGQRYTSYQQRRDGAILRQSTSDWRLRVSDNGNNVHFEIERSGPDVPVDTMAKPTLSQVESMGRQFIETGLSRIVAPGPDEELVFLGSRYGYSGSQAMDSPNRDPDVLLGWTSTFGRSIGGQMVIGAGSKVVVTFRADGSVEGFDADWPAYASSGTTLPTLDVSSLRQRSSQIKAGLPQLAERLQPSMIRRETSFECGMFDRGGRSKRGSAETVQPACQETFETTSPSGERQATILVVPAARVPIADDGWVETRTLCASGAGVCQARPSGW